MKILLTGGAGFIASHIADAYLQQGHEVTIVDDFSGGKKHNVPAGARLVTMDIREPTLDAVFAGGKFDVVNHHAAQIDVRRSIQDPMLDLSINVMGTLRLLESCRAHGVRKFIFASSGGAMYGECKRPAEEGDPAFPESPYGYTKASGEFYIRFFNKFHRLSYTVLRYGNIYGPRQDAQGEAGVVSIFIGKLLRREPVTIYGTGEQERDYVYVRDVVAANVAALTKGENGTYNIGTQIGTSVNTLYQILTRISGTSAAAAYAPPRPGELDRSILNASRAQKELEWRPSRTLEEGLEETYRSFKQGAAPSAVLGKNN